MPLANIVTDLGHDPVGPVMPLRPGRVPAETRDSVW